MNIGKPEIDAGVKSTQRQQYNRDVRAAGVIVNLMSRLIPADTAYGTVITLLLLSAGPRSL